MFPLSRKTRRNMRITVKSSMLKKWPRVGSASRGPLANSMFHTCSSHSTHPINLRGNRRHLENLAPSLSMKSCAPSLTAHTTGQVVFIVHTLFLSFVRIPASSSTSQTHRLRHVRFKHSGNILQKTGCGFSHVRQYKTLSPVSDVSVRYLLARQSMSIKVLIHT